MITPEEFPYIKSLYVNNCYAYRNFNIELHDYKPFSHLILTGKNGSGKSTILRAIHRQIFPTDNQAKLSATTRNVISTENGIVLDEVVWSNSEIIPQVVIAFSFLYKIKNDKSENRLMKPNEVFELYTDKIYSYFEAKRESKPIQVSTVTKEEDFISRLTDSDSTNYFGTQFRQYLVNKKVYQAFDQLEDKKDRLFESEKFFRNLTSILKSIFEDEGLELIFVRESFNIFIRLSDKRQLLFDRLPDGHSALLSIVMDLFIRVDLIRKQVGDFNYHPCGIVLIDEPETHLHLQLQEQVLPLLIGVFPNVQFIVSTHSPAVIASIKNATIFDLTTKESRDSEETVGRSYSDLMRAHFGLNNEYSGIADELFRKVDKILKENKNQPDELKAKLQQFFGENEAYLSPSFRVELESMILENV